MKIKESFPNLDMSTINNTNDLLNDTDLSLKLLQAAFPKYFVNNSLDYFEKMIVSKKQANGISQMQKIGPQPASVFWTTKLIKHFRRSNYTHIDASHQAAYDTTRLEA